MFFQRAATGTEMSCFLNLMRWHCLIVRSYLILLDRHRCSQIGNPANNQALCYENFSFGPAFLLRLRKISRCWLGACLFRKSSNHYVSKAVSSGLSHISWHPVFGDLWCGCRTIDFYLVIIGQCSHACEARSRDFICCHTFLKTEKQAF